MDTRIAKIKFLTKLLVVIALYFDTNDEVERSAAKV